MRFLVFETGEIRNVISMALETTLNFLSITFSVIISKDIYLFTLVAD
jgi:hypothetical protein